MYPALQSPMSIVSCPADEEEELDLADLVNKGEVAWLHREDAPPAQPQRAPPKPQQRHPDSPPLAGLDDLPSACCRYQRSEQLQPLRASCKLD